ncbi:MAG TPA: MFS transporter [Gemmataceae bacterium]|jgi:MFS family permease|nr:MFS transporter [Gemmataceae bacterium]
MKPTRGRFVVLGYLTALTFVLYLDRVCIGKVGQRIREEFGMSATELSYVFSAFGLAYTLFLPIAGRLADRFSGRVVLTVIVLWWSAFTSLTGLAGSFAMLLVIRFLFGAGEAGALPCCARLIDRWFPADSRGFAQGLVNTSALVGATIAPFTTEWIVEFIDERLAPFFHDRYGIVLIGWRWTFVAYGALGVLWAATFWLTYHDEPPTQAGANETDRFHAAVPWGAVTASTNVWLMGLIMSCVSCAAYFFFSWYPSYLEKGRGVAPLASGSLSSLVLAGGAVGSVLGGLLGDLVQRRTGGNRRARSAIGAVSMTLAAGSLVASLATDDALVASALTALAYCWIMLQSASWWGVVSDISGPHVGVLFGVMNGLGAFGAIGGQVLIGRMVDYNESQGLLGRAQWDPGIVFFGGVLLVGAVAWIFVDSNKSAIGESDESHKPCRDGVPLREADLAGDQ